MSNYKRPGEDSYQRSTLNRFIAEHITPKLTGDALERFLMRDNFLVRKGEAAKIIGCNAADVPARVPRYVVYPKPEIGRRYLRRDCERVADGLPLEDD